MSGINWLAYNREKFEEIVEILLRREFGLRGHAVNGRRGDGGIDYDVDDAKMIFQLKFFPDGFTSDTHRRQIKKSFTLRRSSTTPTSGSSSFLPPSPSSSGASSRGSARARTSRSASATGRGSTTS